MKKDKKVEKVRKTQNASTNTQLDPVQNFFSSPVSSNITTSRSSSFTPEFKSSNICTFLDNNCNSELKACDTLTSTSNVSTLTTSLSNMFTSTSDNPLSVLSSTISPTTVKSPSYTCPETPSCPSTPTNTPPGTPPRPSTVRTETIKAEESDHQEVPLIYSCKLCIEKFRSSELLSEHRNSESHQILCESVDEQFLEQIGNKCEECYIMKAEEIYQFCENEEHFEIFQKIWSDRFINSSCT